MNTPAAGGVFGEEPTAGTAGSATVVYPSARAPFPSDMDVDADPLSALDAHDTPVEKTDGDFFNGALPVAHAERRRPLTVTRARTHSWTRGPPTKCPFVAVLADFEDDFDDEDV